MRNRNPNGGVGLKKILASIVLFAAAAVAAILVKDAIDVRHPNNAVAKLTVTADSVQLPVTVAGYQWSFLFDRQTAKIPTPAIDQEPTPTALLGGERLDLSFSQPAVSYTVRQSQSNSYDFFELDGEISVPFEPGGYLYEVRAEFEAGWVLYYFYIAVG